MHTHTQARQHSVKYPHRPSAVECVSINQCWHRCNNGNKAARPTSAGGRGSNHGKGIALDLNLKHGAYDWMRNEACLMHVA